MELWIRTQDKERLLNTTSLCIEIQYDVDPKLHTFNIFANGIKVGNYKTKERALEVLDEIQNHIQKQGKMELDNEVGLKYYGNIYEMPKE